MHKDTATGPEAESPLVQVGQVIRRHRKAAHLSLAALEAKTGIDVSTLSRIENGLRPSLSVDTLMTVSAALNINPAAITAPFFSKGQEAA